MVLETETVGAGSGRGGPGGGWGRSLGETLKEVCHARGYPG